MNNMTNSLRKFKKSYSENTEFSCWLFPYPLSVQGTTIAIRQTSLGITSISLSAVWLYCTVKAFFFAKLTETFFFNDKLFTQANAWRSTDRFSFWRLLFNRRSEILDQPESLLFSGDAKIDVYTSPYIIWFKNPLKWRLPGLSLLLCLESVESVCMMWNILPVNFFWWGS